jgi:uncharacterized protein YjiS (DUF1127 family)
MPCGSTISNSSNILDAASPAFPDPGWSWKILLSWLAGIARPRERRSQYKELLELDDHLLSDIGISRTGGEEVRRSQLYLSAWRDSR